MANVRISVGSRRITKNVPGATAAGTRQVREQMRQVQKNLKAVLNSIDNLTPEAIHFGLQPIFDESQRLVPIDTGALKASGILEVLKTSRGATGSIGYAKANRPPYAIIVHERLDLQHASGKQAKFLEAAVNQHFDEVRPRIVAFLKNNLNL